MRRGSKKVVAVDFDDVVHSFNASFARYYNRTYATAVEYHDMTTYSLHDVFGCVQEIFEDRIVEYYHHEDHHEGDAVVGATSSIRLLSERYELHIVTSRPETAKTPTLRWLSHHLPGHFSGVHFTNGFACKHGGVVRQKIEVCRELGAKVLLEDALHHAKSVAEGGIPVLLPDRPWNQSHNINGVQRFHHWDEAYQWILKNI